MFSTESPMKVKCRLLLGGCWGEQNCTSYKSFWIRIFAKAFCCALNFFGVAVTLHPNKSSSSGMLLWFRHTSFKVSNSSSSDGVNNLFIFFGCEVLYTKFNSKVYRPLFMGKQILEWENTYTEEGVVGLEAAEVCLTSTTSGSFVSSSVSHRRRRW